MHCRRRPVTTAAAPVALPGEAEDILEEILPEPAEQPEAHGFAFDRDAPPARFIWKVGPDGAFSEVSPELSATIGQNAADVVGRRFADVANVFGFDPDGAIAELLDRRDTWSGKN